MDFGERQIEAAQAMVAREADSQVNRIRTALAEDGEDVCVVCDEPIGAARKRALPSAERCIDCQVDWERKNRARAD